MEALSFQYQDQCPGVDFGICTAKGVQMAWSADQPSIFVSNLKELCVSTYGCTYSTALLWLWRVYITIITKSKYKAHTQPLMKQLNILSVRDMQLSNSMKFYYKYKHKEVTDYFASFTLHTQGLTHDHNTRQRDDIRTNRTRINLTENVFEIICRKR